MKEPNRRNLIAIMLIAQGLLFFTLQSSLYFYLKMAIAVVLNIAIYAALFILLKNNLSKERRKMAIIMAGVMLLVALSAFFLIAN